MIKKERYTATNLDTDSAADKRDTLSYYAAYNLEVINNGRNLSISPTKEKGQFSSWSFEVLVGDVTIDGILYLFEHKASGTYKDYIYSITKSGIVTKVVASDFSWIASTQLDVVGNRENENIIKVYWADSINQLRSLNVKDTHTDGVNADLILPVSLSKPDVSIILGGNLIAGKVQYAYSLFHLHGSETKISPLSSPTSISNDMKGGESGEVMTLSAQVDLSGIDTSFEYIRVYSIHYQEENQIPKVTLIYETKISGSTLTIIDDGNLFIQELSLEQFIFLGGVILIPKTIASKNNRLFAANYETTNFDVPFSADVDHRVYGFGINLNPEAVPWSRVESNKLWTPAVVSGVIIPGVLENWNTNESSILYSPVETVRTLITSPTESYSFAQNVLSSGSFSDKLYQEGSDGDDVELTPIPDGLNVTTTGTFPSSDSTTGITVPANKDYRMYLRMECTFTTSGTADIEVHLSLIASGVTVKIISISRTITPIDSPIDIILDDVYFNVDTFDEIELVAQTNNTDAPVIATGKVWSQKLTSLFLGIIIDNPPDTSLYANYDIGGTNGDVENGSLTINGTVYNTTSMSYNYTNQSAVFGFDGSLSGLIDGNSYSGTYSVTTAGNRSPIDGYNITGKIDIAKSSPSYTSYYVTGATASGTAIFTDDGGHTYTIVGETLSGTPGNEYLTLEFALVPVANAIPDGIYAGGVRIQTLALNGTRIPIPTNADKYVTINVNQADPLYTEYYVTAASASGTVYFSTSASHSYSHTVVSSVLSGAPGAESLEIYLGELSMSSSVPNGTWPGGSEITTISLSGTRKPTDLSELALLDKNGIKTIFNNYSSILETYDAINPNYTDYNLQRDITTVGYEGPNFKIYFVASTATSRKYLKQGEVYRIGIVYYNKYMQRSPAKWMCDIKIPYYTPSQGVYISVAFKSDNEQSFIDAGVTNYQLTIVKREPKDRTVSSPGFIVPGVEYIWQNSGTTATGAINPYYTLKRIIYSIENDNRGGGDITKDYTNGVDFHPIDSGVFNAAVPTKDDTTIFFYSSDTAFDIDSLYPPSEVKVVGSARAESNVIPATHGETKITLKEDGGVHGSKIVDGQYYFDLSAQVAQMPKSLLRITNVSSPPGVLQFEHILQHKLSFIQIPHDTYSNISLTDSVILKKGSNANLDGKRVSNTVNISKIVEYQQDDARIVNYAANFADSVALKFSSVDWHTDLDLGIEWSKFAVNGGSSDYNIYLPLLEMIRVLSNQYGGNTYEDKQRNIYMLNGEVTPITVNTSYSQLFLGDIYLGPLIINRSDGLNTLKHAYWNIYDYVNINRLEHNIDVHSRYDKMYNWSLSLDTSTSYELYRIEDNHQLLGAYNQQNTIITGIPKPATFSTVERFDSSIIASKQKFPNEVIDSWSDFLINDVMDLDGIYGDITKLYNFTNEIFAFQVKAVASIIINPQIQIQASDGIGVELGTGTVLYNYKYLTSKSGTNQLWSVIDDGLGIYYYDHSSKSINVHTGEELSTVKKVKNLMLSLTPGVAVRSIYNIEKQDIIFTFDSDSVVYNKYIGDFIRTEDSHNYIHTFDSKVLSLEGNNLNEHYAGSNYNTMHITYLFAPMPTYEKVFHNIEYRKIGSNNFNYISVKDTIGRVGTDTSPTINNKFNINRIHLPRVDDSIDRFRDTNILLTLQCPSSPNELFVDDMVIMYNIKG